MGSPYPAMATTLAYTSSSTACNRGPIIRRPSWSGRQPRWNAVAAPFRVRCVRFRAFREQVRAGFTGCCVFVVVAAALARSDVERIDLWCPSAIGVAREGWLRGETGRLVPPRRIAFVQRELMSGHLYFMDELVKSYKYVWLSVRSYNLPHRF